MAQKKKSSHVGAGMALLAAAAGAYMLYGSKQAAKNRKVVKGWALKAKGEIVEQLEKLSSLDEKSYHTIIDTITKKYASVANVDTKELKQLISEAKGYWKELKKHAETTPTPKDTKKKKK